MQPSLSRYGCNTGKKYEPTKILHSGAISGAMHHKKFLEAAIHNNHMRPQVWSRH